MACTLQAKLPVTHIQVRATDIHTTQGLNYVQFPRSCTGNMELSTTTSPLTNYQPRSVPDWTQIPPVQVCLHMRTIEELTYLLNSPVQNLRPQQNSI